MELDALLALLSETEGEPEQQEILEGQRILLNTAFVDKGTQQVEEWTKEMRHTNALQLSEGLVSACAMAEELAPLRGKVLLAKAKALDSMRHWNAAAIAYGEARQRFELLGDTEKVAECDLGEGRVLLKLDDLDGASRSLDRAQVVFAAAASQEGMASCLLSQGNVHYVRAKYDSALACYADAQKIFETLGVRDQVAECKRHQGIVHVVRGDPLLAEKYYQEARAIFEAEGLKGQIAVCDISLGNLYRTRGEYGAALQYLEQARASLQMLGVQDQIAICLLNLGRVHEARGDWEDALLFYQEARAAFVELENMGWAARCDLNEGNIHLHRSDYDAALACYHRAQPVFDALGDRDEVAACVMNQGIVHYYRGQYATSLECYEQARALFAGLGVKSEAANCVFCQGLIHEAQGEYDAALMRFREGQSLFADLNERDQVARCIMSQGMVHHSRGEYDMALADYRQAQAIFEELPVPDGTADCVSNQGAVHLDLGEYDAALTCYQRAQAVYEALGSRDRAATCVMNQGNVHASRGEYDAALGSYQQAQAVYEELGSRDRAANCVGNQGHAHRSRGEYDAALECYQRAQAVYEELGMQPAAMQVLYGLGDVYRERGDQAAALRCFTEATEERPLDALWYPEIQWQVRRGLARLDSAGRQALIRYDECLAIVDTLRGRQQTDWSKTGVLHDKEGVYAEAIRWCLDRRSEDRDHVRRAFAYAERAKARALLDLMDQAGPALRARNEKVQTHLMLLQQHQAEQQRLRELGQLAKAVELSAPMQREQEALAELSFEDASLAAGRVRDLETIRQALPGGAALIEFYYHGDTQAAFLLTGERLDVFPLRLDALLPTFPGLRRAIQDRAPLAEVQAGLARCCDVLLKESGLWEQLRDVEQLIIVPHGELHGLPFAALYDHECGQYLAEQKILSVVPSASILDVCRAKNPGRRQSCLWVYAPATEPTDLAISGSAGSGSLLAQYGAPPALVQERFASFRPVCGPDANIANTMALLTEESWDVVHFYCHADAHPDSPLLSHLVLAGGTPNAPQPAKLRAVDIFNLPLQASLVVLGACQTAVGTRRPGDDIISLTRAFFRAGTPSVLASLWRVPARDTADLLNYFYADEATGWLAGADKAVALQAAQRRILLGEPHPYYWAGFVLYGDWS